MKYKIKIGFFFVLMALAVLITSRQYFPALALSVTLHELGHIIAAKLRHIELTKFNLGILGATLFPKEQLFSYRDEIILCLGGPLVNFFSVIVCISFDIPKTSFFILSSLALGMLNMLPINDFDGGRIFSAFLHIHLSDHTAERVSRAVSFICLFSLWSISVYFIIRYGATLSLFVFSTSIFTKIFMSKS